jgi:hypothetical protein
MKSPADLGETEIKEYLAHVLLQGAQPATLRGHVAALKFLYGVTLNRAKEVERIPWPKVPHKKPVVLSGSEVEQVLAAVKGAPGVVLTAAYAAGLRIAAPKPTTALDWRVLFRRLTGLDLALCPICKGRLVSGALSMAQPLPTPTPSDSS